MPTSRRESTGGRASVPSTGKSFSKDSTSSSLSKSSCSKMSSSDHLVPIAPRNLPPAVHDPRFTYRPVMRPTNQPAVYSYHSMSSSGMALHSPASSPYQAYYPRPMMIPSSAGSSEGMMPNLSYTAGTDVHPQVPVGVTHGGYAYTMGPWQAPMATSRKRKSTRVTSQAEKVTPSEVDNSDDQVDCGLGNGKSDKKKDLRRGSMKSIGTESTADSDGDPFPPLSIVNGNRRDSAEKHAAEADSQLHPSGTTPVASDDDEKFPSPDIIPQSQAPVSMSDISSCNRDQMSPGVEDGMQRIPDAGRGFPVGACKKVYNQNSNHVAADRETSIEPLSALDAPSGLDAADELNHYKKTVASLHDRLKKEHELCQQASSQRIRAEMMWEAVAQELRQLRVHLARLATQPLPTAMSGSMQMS